MGLLAVLYAVINSSEFKVIPVINKLQQRIKANLADLRMRFERQNAVITELMKAQNAECQA